MSASTMRSMQHAPYNQRGLTLIETAIAMTIALFLLAGVMTIVGGTRATADAQNKMAQLQDNERLAMGLMTDIVEAAGYFPNPVANTREGVLVPSAAFLAAGQGIAGTFNAANPGDTINIRFATGGGVGGDGLINCTGLSNPAAAITLYENQFSVDAATGQLQCALNGAAAVPLVTGLQKMVILYGVNTKGGTQTCADSYMTATEVTAGGALGPYWNNVCSVKVTLVFVNPLKQGPATIQFTRVIAVMNTAGANT
jgi:type IV pilus assembly protein PilW